MSELNLYDSRRPPSHFDSILNCTYLFRVKENVALLRYYRSYHITKNVLDKKLKGFDYRKNCVFLEYTFRLKI